MYSMPTYLQQSWDFILQAIEETDGKRVLVVLSQTSLYMMLGYLAWRERAQDPMEAVWMLADYSETLGLEKLGLDEGPQGFVSEV